MNRPPAQAPRPAAAISGPSVRRRLVLFALALTLPMLAFTGFLLWRFAAAERVRVEGDALDKARNVALAIDRELGGLAAALNVLASSPLLRGQDLEGFYRQAAEVRDRTGHWVVLVNGATRQQLVNTRVAWGTPLPRSNIEPLRPEELGARRAFISNLLFGALSQTPVFTVQTAVERTGAPPDTLALSIPVEVIRDLMIEEEPSAAWTISVIDRTGVVLARNRRHEEFIGRKATQDLLDNTRDLEGSWRGQTLEGFPVFGAYARSRLSDWRVAIGVREEELNAPLRRSLWLFAGLGAALAALSAALALGVGRGIAGPIRRLAAQAAALGRGEPVEPLPTALYEASLVGGALAAASTGLREREQALRQLNATLEERVAARTDELAAANERLRAEMEERGRVEEQLRQAQKMEAVGQLTGGIAHDFNNLLTVIVGNLGLVGRRLGDADPRVRRGVENALAGAARAAALTHRLLAFSRQQPLDPKPTDVNKLVGGLSDLLRRTLGETIAIETVLAGGLWRASIDANQLENAILNLAVNARDAMPDGGKLTIETANAHLDEAYAAAHPDVTPGRYVLVAVCDTGSGMPPEVAARVFEPFYTTKPVGQGTGLGLSQVYGFLKQSGGHVAIYSEPGQGTTVKLYLPRMRREAGEPIDGPAEAPGAAPAAAGGEGETILVVEDEAMVRRFSVEALRDAGYRVLEAADGPGGLDTLRAHPEIALLFTDVVLAGPLNGRALADEAARLRPDLPVLFTTGYTRNAIVHHGRLDENVQLLGKPFTAASLAAKVRELLGGEPVRTA